MHYNVDNKLKKKMLIRNIYNTNKAMFLLSLTLCLAFFLLGILLFVGSVHVFGMLGIAVGIIFFSIPFAFSCLIWHKSILKLGSPYSEMCKEFVHIEKAGVEFGYHDVLNRWLTSMDLYQICFEDIQSIEYDEKGMLLTLTGVARLTVYDDFAGGRINYSKSQRNFYPDSKYSFILAFKEAEEIIKKIDERIGK